MKIKMYTSSEPVIVEANDVTQFYPDSASGGERTIIETLSAEGKKSKVSVNHGFQQVLWALSNAWELDKKKGGVA